VNLNEVAEIMTIISGIITAVASPLILGFIYFLIRMIKKDRSAHKKLTNALISIQKNTFVSIYYSAKKAGGIELYERSMLEEMYKSYGDLGGNSFVEKIMKEIDEIKTLD